MGKTSHDSVGWELIKKHPAWFAFAAAFLAVIAGVLIDYIPARDSKQPEWLLGAIGVFLSVLMSLLVRVAADVDQIKGNHKTLAADHHVLANNQGSLREEIRRIHKHDRIMFPHIEHPERYVVGVDDIPEESLPDPRDGPDPDDNKKQWTITYSVLRRRWLQDLLFADKYLKHVVKSKEASEVEHRLLIVDGKFKSKEKHVLKAYTTLVMALDVAIHVVTESEYEDFLASIPRVLGRWNGVDEQKVRRFMREDPELSLLGNAIGPKLHIGSPTNGVTKLLFRHGEDLGGVDTVGVAELAAVNLFLESFRTTNGDVTDKRRCGGSGVDPVSRALSVHPNTRIDLVQPDKLKSQWDERAVALGLKLKVPQTEGLKQ